MPNEADINMFARQLVDMGMGREGEDPKDSFAWMQRMADMALVHGPRLAVLVRGWLEDWALDRDRCPECGAESTTRIIVLGVHPYGSTTATEHGAELYCPECEWVEEG